jgi:signal transduction histidine kinase
LKQISKITTYIIFITTFLLGTVNFTFAKQSIEDSLKQQLIKTEQDSTKAKLLLQLASCTNNTNKEQSIDYYSEALSFESDNYRKATILDTIGLLNWQLGNFTQSIKFYNQALKIFNQLNDSAWIGKITNNIAVSNWGLGNSNEALEFYQISLKIKKERGDLHGVSNILNNIGLIYQDWGLYDEAYTWHKQALDIAIDIKSYLGLAYSYSNLGKYYENKKEYEKSLTHHKLGYENLLLKNNMSRSNSFFLKSIGDVYREMGKLDLALSSYKESLEQAQIINNKNRIAIAEYRLGETYFTLNKIDSANKYINRSYNKSMLLNYDNLIKDNEFILSAIEEKKGNISKALKYFKSASAMKDSTFNQEKIAKFTDLQVKYYLEQKSQENILLRVNNEMNELVIKEQKYIRNFLVISGVFILIILVVISKSRTTFKKLNAKLNKSEKELLEINDNKDKFFTIISHDLRSPFGGLLGMTDMLVSDYNELSSDEIKEMIKIIKHSSNNIYELLNGLLEWARTQTGRMEYKFENLDLFENAMRAINFLKTNAFDKYIKIENEIKEKTFAFADENATSTILRNLVSNAIKYSNPGGIVEISSENIDNQVVISVSDNGVGMSEEDMNKLFKIEFRHTTVGTNKELGTGFGLVLCKELVEKQGGKIWVESELRKGSKFVFTLPLIESD